VVERFVALSDRRRWALGETLEYAVAALTYVYFEGEIDRRFATR
jgi:hypothetical protein